MYSLLEQLRQHFSQALVNAFGNNYANTDPLVVPAAKPEFGDYQSNIALSLAKQLKQKPRDTAQQIINHLNIANLCELPEVAGPGFINLTLKPTALQNLLQTIAQDSQLGAEKAQTPQRIIVDFSSPNIAKEMHVGHLRSTIIGDCIARILEFRGYDVLRINHVGDWGTQFGMLIAYLREAYPDALTKADALALGDLVTLYRQAKKRFDEDEQFQKTAREEVVKLQKGAEDSVQAWKLLCEQSRREFQVIYDLLGVELTERGESFYNAFLPDVVKELEETGLLEEDQGAKCVFLAGFSNKSGQRLPLIVQKSDSGYNYATTDLAAIRYRIREDRAKRILYVTDAGQSNHFAQVFQVAKRAGWIPDDVELIHVPFGLVQGEDGKKLKTRSGDTIRLRDLLDEAIARSRQDLEQRFAEEGRNETQEFIEKTARIIGISAVKYADLGRNRTSNYVFSYEKMLDRKGDTAPYLLYAYVRVQGISRKGDIDLTKLGNQSLILEDNSELVLAKHILQLSDVLKEVEQDLLPNRLCLYLFELSQKFNQFYDRCPVLQAEEPKRTSRLMLADLTARTLKLGLYLLGIEVLERM